MDILFFLHRNFDDQSSRVNLQANVIFILLSAVRLF